MSLTAVLLLTGFAGSARQSSVRLEKVVQEFTRSTGGSCDLDACVLTTDWAVPITTPAGQSEIDLLVTVSFTYQLSQRDFGLAVAGVVLDGETRGTCLTPESYRLAAQGGRKTSVALTWFREGVPADGRSHRVYFSVLTRDGNGDLRHWAYAGRGIVVVERF
ncbi:MAG: hypothetical protein ACRDNG_11505 [Gaiellaceae bacterium]